MNSESGSRRGREKVRKRSLGFAEKFNVRTNRLIELSKSNSCSVLTRHDSEASLGSVDGCLSQSSGSYNNTKRDRKCEQRQKRLKERAEVKPLSLDKTDIITFRTVMKTTYTDLLDERSPIDAFDVLLATLRSNLASQMWWTEREELHVRLFIRNYLLTPPTQLAQKYLLGSGDVPLNRKLGEFKLQTLLHMFAIPPETESLTDSGSDGAVMKEEELEQVVAILRMISSTTDTVTLQVFLNQDILETFLDRIPAHLARLFDELNQPLPTELASFATQDSDDGDFDEEVLRSPVAKRKGSMVDNEILEMERPKLMRRASFLDTRHHKLVQIPSSGVKQLQVKGEKKKTTVSGGSKGKTRQARRSLTFDGSSKQQTPSKKRATIANNKSPRTPKRDMKLKKALVRDTPLHKQRPMSEYRQEKFRRQNTNCVRQIVAETPEKALFSMLGVTKTPPRRQLSRTSATTAPTALTQLDEENVNECSTSEQTSSQCDQPSNDDDRRRLLFKEFLGGEKKSPRKRIVKVARAIRSLCSKSNFAQDVFTSGFRQC